MGTHIFLANLGVYPLCLCIFETDISIRSKVIRGSQNFEIWSRDPGHAHLGVVLWSGRSRGSVIYVLAKFEADISIRSKVIRGVPKFRNLVT